MCAINGITWSSEAVVRAMNSATAHRGPDGTAVAVYPSVTFGHNRLAIIDPDPRSNQPMVSGDGNYSIIFNGEIYNFKELKQQLVGKYDFKTESDTEVILAGYRKWGNEVFSRLNGMFALALYEHETGAVVLARDPVGIKPLYLTKVPLGYAFSSEIKALLPLLPSRIVDLESFELYMRTLYVPAPRTMFQGVESLMPGTITRLERGERVTATFSFSPTTAPLDSRDSKGLRMAVMEAVERQMLSDRPLGIFLSGGIDSSSVLASASSIRSGIDTYSISFELEDMSDDEKFNTDARLAKRIASHFGACHHEWKVTPKEVIPFLEKAAFHLDQPVANGTVVAQLALASHARESVVVALTGDGGDEVFGGYERYRLARLMEMYQRTTGPLGGLINTGVFEKLNTRTNAERFQLFHFQKDHQLAPLLSRPLTDRGEQFARGLFEGGDRDPHSLMRADRRTWLVDEALLRSDKLGLAYGLELRPPLLDLELLHQTSQFPFEHQVSLYDTKKLLKRAFAPDLPSWVVRQPKRGWFSPSAKWFRHPALTDAFDGILSREYAPNTSALFNWEGVRQTLGDHRAKKIYAGPALLAMVMFQLWARKFEVK